MRWQKILAQGFSCAAELLTFLELPVSLGSHVAEQRFASRIPLGFANRMHKGNARDPLLLQALALPDELTEVAGYGVDPLNERDTNPVPGVIHKYAGRVLVTLTGVCAINCRFCFRRHFPYAANTPGRRGLEAMCAYIARDTSITEVILSGGDPLMASDTVLQVFMEQLALIPHVHTLRFHTRIPVVLPERVDAGLTALLATTRLHKVMVLHCNHAQEIDAHVAAACADLHQAGCHLLNQSVLLAGINDDAQTLIDLSYALFACQVLPYYLHLPDKVQGTAHFDVPLEKATRIYTALRNALPGYLVPRLAREDAGLPAKTLLV